MLSLCRQWLFALFHTRDSVAFQHSILPAHSYLDWMHVDQSLVKQKAQAVCRGPLVQSHIFPATWSHEICALTRLLQDHWWIHRYYQNRNEKGTNMLGSWWLRLVASWKYSLQLGPWQFPAQVERNNLLLVRLRTLVIHLVSVTKNS